MRQYRIVMVALLAAVCVPAAADTPALLSIAGLESRETIIEPAFGDFDGEETLHYDGTWGNAIGPAEGGIFTGAARFVAPSACTLKAVLFHQYHECGNSFALVWAAGTETTPGATLDSAPYDGGSTSWRRIDYLHPPVFNQGDEFWIGIRMVSWGYFTFSTDVGPMHPNGGFFYPDSVRGMAPNWGTLQNLGYDASWCLRAIVVRLVPGVTESRGGDAAMSQFRLPTPCTRRSIALPAELGEGRVRVYDRAGHLVRSHDLAGGAAELSLDGLNSGLYFIRLDTGPARGIHKLLLVR
jgi:hypothetical protein